MRTYLLAVLSVLSVLSATAQTGTVFKNTSNNRLIESLKVPSGKTLTIESGGTLVAAAGSTITGITATPAWSDITGKPTTLAGYGITDSITAAVAASTYHPLTATSTGGFGTADSGKLAKFSSAGSIASTTFQVVSSNGLLSNDPQLVIGNTSAVYYHAFVPSLLSTTLGFATPSSLHSVLIPAIGTAGSPATLISNLDTGTVTAAMLAGSIPISKLSITGTPDGTKFIRDDGSYQTISTGLTIGSTAITGGTSGRLLTSGANVGEQTLGSGVSTWLGTPSLANFNAALSDADVATLAANTFTGVQTLPAGAVGAPSLTLGDAATGFYRSAADQIAVAIAGTQRLRISASNLTFASSSSGTDGITITGAGGQTVTLIAQFGPAISGPANWQSRTDSSVGRFTATNATAATTYFTLSDDATAGVLQIGLDSATPVSQTVKTADGSGTNIAASNLTLGGSKSTGIGAGGDVVTITSMSGSSGSAANATQERSRAVGRFVNLTESTATSIASIALASGKVTGGTATVTVWASDGTDCQALTTEVRFAAVNKAGTVTATCTQTDGTTAASAGTLTVTYDVSTSGNNMLLRANAASSLTQTTLRARFVITALNGDDVQTVTPQ